MRRVSVGVDVAAPASHVSLAAERLLHGAVSWPERALAACAGAGRRRNVTAVVEPLSHTRSRLVLSGRLPAALRLLASRVRIHAVRSLRHGVRTGAAGVPLPQAARRRP